MREREDDEHVEEEQGTPEWEANTYCWHDEAQLMAETRKWAILQISDFAI